MRRELLGLSIAAILIVGLPVSTPAEPSPSPDDLLFPVVLGTYSTTLIGSIPARTDNIRLAARALDGVVLDPGQVLSFNRRVGRRSIERGYQQAPVILHELRFIALPATVSGMYVPELEVRSGEARISISER